MSRIFISGLYCQSPLSAVSVWMNFFLDTYVTAVLLVMSGASANPVFGLTVHDRRHHWSIGRGPEQSISLGDVSVSARHATLIYDDGRWAIQDERSSNRVKVNNSTQTLSPLRDGDLISLGKVDLVFRLTG